MIARRRKKTRKKGNLSLRLGKQYANFFLAEANPSANSMDIAKIRKTLEYGLDPACPVPVGARLDYLRRKLSALEDAEKNLNLEVEAAFLRLHRDVPELVASLAAARRAADANRRIAEGKPKIGRPKKQKTEGAE